MSEISRPELLNRIGDNIVPFNYILSPDVQKEIVRSQFKRILQDFEDRWHSAQYRLVFDDSVAPWLVAKYSEQIAEFGARCIVNAVEKEIETPLAYPSLEAEDRGAQGVTFRVTVDADGQRIDILEE